MNAHDEALQRAFNQMNHIAAGNKPLYNPKASLEAAISERRQKAIDNYDSREIVAYDAPKLEKGEISAEAMAASIEHFYESSRFKD